MDNNYEHVPEDSIAYDDNPRLSNTENDFEDLTHSETGEQHVEAFNDAYTASAIEQEPPKQQYAHTTEYQPEKEQYHEQDDFDEPSQPPEIQHSNFTDDHGDIYQDEQSSSHKPAYEEEEEEDEVKAASEASELLKRRMPPQVRNIVYWNCPFTTAALFSSLLLFEFSLLFFSVISVLAYTGLAVMVASLCLKLYVHFVASGSSTTIHRYIEGDWNVSNERTEQVSRDILNKVNSYVLYVRDLFLINNYGESIKFAIFLYFLTYIGAWFNFLTLVILGTVSTFSIPKVYDIYKKEIDHVISLARRQFKEKWAIVQSKMGDLPVVGQKLKRN